MVGSVKTFGNKRRGDHSPDIPRDETLRSSNAPLISREAAAYFKGPPLLLVIFLVYCNYGKHRPWPLYHASLVFQPVTIFIYSTSFEISARRKWKNSLSFFFVRAHLEWSTKKKIRKLWITYIRNIYPRRNAFTLISRRANSNKINEERLLRRLIRPETAYFPRTDSNNTYTDNPRTQPARKDKQGNWNELHRTCPSLAHPYLKFLRLDRDGPGEQLEGEGWNTSKFLHPSTCLLQTHRRVSLHYQYLPRVYIRVYTIPEKEAASYQRDAEELRASRGL